MILESSLTKEVSMKPFGLTGNIGCGKSTVARFLAKIGRAHV